MENKSPDLEQELLPKPLTDLPLPEKEIPANIESGNKSVSIFKNKFFWGFLTLSTLAAFLICGFYLGKNKANDRVAQSPTPIISQTPTDPTVNWKTYRNEKLGFEFKYPSKYEEKYDVFIDEKPGEILAWTNPYPSNDPRSNEKTPIIIIITDKNKFLSVSTYKLCEEVGTPKYEVPCLDQPVSEITLNKNFVLKKINIRESDTGGKLYAQQLNIPIEIQYGDANILTTFKFTDSTLTESTSAEASILNADPGSN